MNKKVLVAYGSKRGATAELAEKIGETLRGCGIQAEVREAGTVSDVTAYGAVILGSAVYIGLWHKNAARFLKKNADKLALIPVWFFISGPTGPGDPVAQMDGWLYPKSLAPFVEQVKPRGIACFGGKIVIEALNAFERWIVKKVKAPAGDFRDWEAVAAWADVIAGVVDNPA